MIRLLDRLVARGLMVVNAGLRRFNGWLSRVKVCSVHHRLYMADQPRCGPECRPAERLHVGHGFAVSGCSRCYAAIR